MDKEIFCRASFPDKIVVNLSEDTKAKLRAIAKDHKMTISEAARAIIADYIRKYEAACGPINAKEAPKPVKRQKPIDLPTL